jgi:hypothetical protein
MASNDGRIMAINACDNHKVNYILKPKQKSKHPYHMYRVIGDDGKRRVVYLHTLVISAFLGPKPFEKAVTRHLDGNAMNNTPENLCWGTQKENIYDSIEHGTFAYNLSHCDEEPIGRELVEYWRCLVKLGFTKRAIAQMYGLHHTYVGKWTNRIYV